MTSNFLVVATHTKSSEVLRTYTAHNWRVKKKETARLHTPARDSKAFDSDLPHQFEEKRDSVVPQRALALRGTSRTEIHGQQQQRGLGLFTLISGRASSPPTHEAPLQSAHT